MVKEHTCFESVANPSCIDIVLTNREKMVQKTLTVETTLSDFHKMTVAVLKSHYKKRQPKVVSYGDYKDFSSLNFIHDDYFYMKTNKPL